MCFFQGGRSQESLSRLDLSMVKNGFSISPSWCDNSTVTSKQQIDVLCVLLTATSGGVQFPILGCFPNDVVWRVLGEVFLDGCSVLDSVHKVPDSEV